MDMNLEIKNQEISRCETVIVTEHSDFQKEVTFHAYVSQERLGNAEGEGSCERNGKLPDM